MNEQPAVPSPPGDVVAVKTAERVLETAYELQYRRVPAFLQRVVVGSTDVDA